MNILGLSDVTGNHSHSCVALLENGRLSMALSQERLSRIKNDSAFPYEAIETVLQARDLDIDEIDLFACGYPAPHYYASLLARSVLDLPRALFGVARSRPDRLLKYLLPNLKKAIYDPGHLAGNRILQADKLVFVDHHLAHVTAAFAASGMDECLAISYGGFAPHLNGRNVAGAVYRCCGDQISLLEEIPFHATGCWFSGITVALGFRYMQQEGKIMGLAGLGDAQVCYKAIQSIATRFADDHWLAYRYWVDYIFSPRAEVFLSSHSGRILQSLLKRYKPQDVAAAAQRVWQENSCNFINYLIRKYRIKKFALAGGLFLNAPINQAIAEETEAEAVVVFPHTGDGSTAIGAALQVHQSATGVLVRRNITDTGWGCDLNKAAILQDILKFAQKLYHEEIWDVPDYVARQISAGKIVGWFQGPEEYGPRSLGHRCIFADCRIASHKAEINRRKGREVWIPIGVSCLMEYGLNYFVNWQPAPFMTRTFTARQDKISLIPAAVHNNGSVRVQSVSAEQDKLFRKMVKCFYDLTGMPLVLNSSLNRHGEPIVHRPAEAMALVLAGVVDMLIIADLAVRARRE